jgi:hypothetical protein
VASIFGSIENLIHNTAQAVIDAQITTKISDTYSGFVSSGFGVVNDTIKIVRDITAPTPPAPPPAPPPGH